MNTTIISIISACIAGLALIANLVDRIKKSTKESNLELIKYRLDEIDKNMQKICEKLDKYDNEIDEKINKAMEMHVAFYHKRKKGES